MAFFSLGDVLQTADALVIEVMIGPVRGVQVLMFSLVLGLKRGRITI